MSGFVGNLSRKQEDALKRFRETLRDVWREEFDDDYYLLRWLRARGFDVKKAEKMLRAHLDWRKEVGADTILEDYVPNPVIERFYPGGFCGRNKNGQPLWIDPTGHSDLKGLARSVTRWDLLRSRIHLMEYVYRVLLPEYSKEVGHRVEQTVVIFDLQHFGLKHMWRPGLDMLLDIAKMCEANYPETMSNCYVVNAPTFFPAVYRIVKPFLHECTQRKIQVLGSNYRDILRRYFNPPYYPARFGGEMQSPDGSPDCCHLVCYGGDVPTDLYLSCDRSLMQERTVARGSVIAVDTPVERPGQRLCWELVSDEHDIAFGVWEGGKAVVELRRVSCHIAPEKGSVTCPRGGTYVLKLDNSFSWTRAKRVWFRVWVEDEDEEEEEEEGSEDDGSFVSANED